jgi:hypothetical protein
MAKKANKGKETLEKEVKSEARKTQVRRTRGRTSVEGWVGIRLPAKGLNCQSPLRVEEH